MMCLHAERSPNCGNDSRVPTKNERADSSSEKASSSRQDKKAVCRRSLKKRRPTRVLYPAQVRKYLPRQEKDKAKKWLLILGAIVFFQIFLEDGDQCDREVHKTLVASDSNAIKFQGHAKPEDSRTFLVHGPENVTLGNSTILSFITGTQGTRDSLYYDLRNDSA